jgi:hypothetical protein
VIRARIEARLRAVVDAVVTEIRAERADRAAARDYEATRAEIASLRQTLEGERHGRRVAQEHAEELARRLNELEVAPAGDAARMRAEAFELGRKYLEIETQIEAVREILDAAENIDADDDADETIPERVDAWIALAEGYEEEIADAWEALAHGVDGFERGYDETTANGIDRRLEALEKERDDARGLADAARAHGANLEQRIRLLEDELAAARANDADGGLRPLPFLPKVLLSSLHGERAETPIADTFTARDAECPRRELDEDMAALVRFTDPTPAVSLPVDDPPRAPRGAEAERIAEELAEQITKPDAPVWFVARGTAQNRREWLTATKPKRWSDEPRDALPFLTEDAARMAAGATGIVVDLETFRGWCDR